MNLTAVEKEIRRILVHIERWQEQGYTPSIEQGIVLNRLQKVYDLIMDQETIDAEEDSLGNKFEKQFSIGKDARNMFTEESPAGYDKIPTSGENYEKDPFGDISDIKPETDLSISGPGSESGANIPNEEKPTPPEEIMVHVYTIFGETVPADLHDDIVKDLFAGDQTLFAAELAKLEKMDSLDDALIYIGENYKWNPDSPSVNRFIELMSAKLN